MKKSMKCFFVSALMLLVTISLVACGGNEIEATTNAPFGVKYPERIKTKFSINASMSALKMYEVGVKNYDEIDFVASRQLGTIITKTPIGKLHQSLDAIKIKDNSKLYLESNTITTAGFPAINLIDQSIFENGKYRVRTAKDISVKDDMPIIKAWNSIKSFDSLAQGLKDFPNDPSRINMYTINEGSVVSSTKPVFDAKNNIYKFELVLDNSLATIDHIVNMKHNAEAGGIENPSIAFDSVKVTVEMWSNGLIKSIASDELYKIKGKVPVVGEKTNETALLATTYFTYDTTECNISNYIKF